MRLKFTQKCALCALRWRKPIFGFSGGLWLSKLCGTSLFVYCTDAKSENDLGVEHDRCPSEQRVSVPFVQEFVYTSPNSSLDVSERIIPLFSDGVRSDVSAPDLGKTIFSHISEEYDALGQVLVEEVEVTVQPHVFSQIGVVDVNGVREMASMILRESFFANGSEPIVFCDIGSGVGNVLMQILGEVPQCKRVVGVEVIPSRHRMAQAAYAKARALYPQWYRSSHVDTTTTTTVTKSQRFEVSGDEAPNQSPALSSSTSSRKSTTTTRTIPKDATFHLTDLVNASPALSRDGVNVIFSHSWMFDDDLMLKFAQMVNDCGSTVRMVITSRPFKDINGLLTLDAGAGWQLAGTTTLSADWNPKSPFYVYVRS